MINKFKLMFIFLIIVIFLVSCKKDYSGYDIKLEYSKIPFLNDVLTEMEEELDIIILKEYSHNGFNQILYKKKATEENGSNALYSAIIVDGKIYDFGEVDYKLQQSSIDNDRYKAYEVDINENMALYKIFVGYGAASFADKYFWIVDNRPYILTEIYGSLDYDLDGDGQVETVSQTGTLSALSIYEWANDTLMCSYLPDLIDNYYGGHYNEAENEIRLVRLIDGKVSEEERYKYVDRTLHRVK